MPEKKTSHDNLLQTLRDGIPDQEIRYEGLLKALREGAEICPFNKVLGLKIVSLAIEDVCVKFEMKDELIGNEIRRIVHGGVISSVLDVTGSITAAVGILKQMKERPIEEIIERYLKVGTIDLRIDFLKPGEGKYFLATGSVLRTGGTVSVTRAELRNDQKQLIAVATGTYKVG